MCFPICEIVFVDLLKAKGGCEDVIEEDSIGIHLCSDSGKVLEPRIHLLHLLSSHTHVLPPVEPGVKLSGGIVEQIKIVRHCF